MSRKTLGILDGGRGGASIARGGVGVLEVWIRAEHNILDCWVTTSQCMRRCYKLKLVVWGPIYKISYDNLTINRKIFCKSGP